MKEKELTSKIDQRQADLFRCAATHPNSWRSAAHGHLAVARMLYDALVTDAEENPNSEADLPTLHKCQESYGLAVEAFFKALAVDRGLIFIAGDRLVIPDQFADRRLAEMARALGLQMSGFELDLLTAMGLFLRGTTKRLQHADFRSNRTPLGSGGVDPSQMVRTNHLEQMDAFAAWVDQLLEKNEMSQIG